MAAQALKAIGNPVRQECPMPVLWHSGRRAGRVIWLSGVVAITHVADVDVSHRLVLIAPEEPLKSRHRMDTIWAQIPWCAWRDSNPRPMASEATTLSG